MKSKSVMPRSTTSKLLAVVMAAAGLPFAVHADGRRKRVVYDRERGELSPGTQAPEPQRMVDAIRSGSPMALDGGARIRRARRVHGVHPAARDQAAR